MVAIPIGMDSHNSHALAFPCLEWVLSSDISHNDIGKTVRESGKHYNCTDRWPHSGPVHPYKKRLQRFRLKPERNYWQDCLLHKQFFQMCLFFPQNFSVRLPLLFPTQCSPCFINNMYTIIANTFHFRGNNLLLFYYTEHMLFKIHSLFPIYGFFLTTLPITFPLHYPMTRIW